jgi:hypothetical protein
VDTKDVNALFGSTNAEPLLDPSSVTNWEPFFEEARDTASTMQICVPIADFLHIEMADYEEENPGNQPEIEEMRAGIVADEGALGRCIQAVAADTFLEKLSFMHGGPQVVRDRGFFPVSESAGDHDRMTFILNSFKTLAAKEIQIINTDDTRRVMKTLASVLDCLNPSGTAPELTEEVESRLADDSRFNKTFNGDINTFADTLVRIHDRFRDLYTEAAGGDQSLLEPLSAYHTELSARLSKSIGERETLTADEEAKREARRSEFE